MFFAAASIAGSIRRGLAQEGEQGPPPTGLSGLGAYSQGMGIVCDAKRDLIWGLNCARKTFVIRIDPKTLKIIENP